MGGNDLSNVRKIKLKKTKYGEKEKSKWKVHEKNVEKQRNGANIAVGQHGKEIANNKYNNTHTSTIYLKGHEMPTNMISRLE